MGETWGPIGKGVAPWFGILQIDDLCSHGMHALCNL